MHTPAIAKTILKVKNTLLYHTKYDDNFNNAKNYKYMKAKTKPISLKQAHGYI